MILAIDIGNTNIVVGCMEDNRAVFVERMSTDTTKTSLEYAMGIKMVLELDAVRAEDIEGAIISSVVPPLTGVVREAIRKIAGCDAIVVGPGVKTGLNILIDNPKSMGADIVVASVAAIKKYGAPCIIVDMGTATTIVAIDKNANYLGGAIVPGIISSLDSLVERTAQLPRISIEAPQRTIGRTTEDGMKSGVVYGSASLIDGLIERMEEELGYHANLIATGGMAGSIVKYCKHDIHVDDELLLEGLNIIYRKNV